MTTMDQIHHIRELFYSQGKNISEMFCNFIRLGVAKYTFGVPMPRYKKETEVKDMDGYVEIAGFTGVKKG